jgi:histidinol dehydrogenase
MKLLYWNRLDASARHTALQRAPQNRSGETRRIVTEILEQVRRDGDAAVRQLTFRLDGVDLTEIRVSDRERQQAAARLDGDIREAIDEAAANIRAFHVAGMPRELAVETVPGVICEARYVGIERVGLYAPGGGTPLPSSVLMMGVPARLAGCRRKILCTTPTADGGIHPAMAYAAQVCDVDDVFHVGGAQAIAAMAWGTESVPACDKLFGPGSIWVTEAKRQVASGDSPVTIDMAAGPSEVLVIADDTAKPRFVAADMAAQMEHGADSQAILVTTSEELAREVRAQFSALSESLPRREQLTGSAGYSRILVVQQLDEAVEIANRYAAEHLIIQTRDPADLLDSITAAGSVFLGEWTPEVLGDYCSGTNHVLPTCGLARSVNGLSVTDFMKRITVQQATPQGLLRLARTATRLARTEGLTAHALAVETRQQAIDSGVRS